jgi:hypothetical protein
MGETFEERFIQDAGDAPEHQPATKQQFTRLIDERAQDPEYQRLMQDIQIEDE